MDAELRKLAANLFGGLLGEDNPDPFADDLGQVAVDGPIATESMLCNSGGSNLESQAYGV